MITPDEAKRQIEIVHKKYLIKLLGLMPAKNILSSSDSGVPDFIDSANTHFLELKSRNYPYKQMPDKKKRYESSFDWWALDALQIKRHEELAQKYEIENAWIFLLSHSNKPLTSYSRIDELVIQRRKVFIVPSGVHKLANLSPTGFYNLHLPSIKAKYDFSLRCRDRAMLYVERGLESKLKDLF